MSELSLDDIFDQDRGEAEEYAKAEKTDEVFLPLTKSGFEALLTRVCDLYKLPLDDRMRAVMAGYIHHIPNEKNSIEILQLSRVLYKSVANSTSWRIDQDIKIKRREAEAHKEIQAKLEQELPSQVQ